MNEKLAYHCGKCAPDYRSLITFDLDSCKDLPMNTDFPTITRTPRTTIIDPATGQVITTVPVAAAVGSPAFRAAEGLGHRFTDGKVYLTLPVTDHGIPVSSTAGTLFIYRAPAKSTAERFTV